MNATFAPSGRTMSRLISLAAFVVVVAGLRAAQSIVTPILLAAFLAVICFPPLTWLVRKGLPNWLALLIVIGAAVLVLLGIIGLIGSSLSQFYEQLPEYQKQLVEQTKQFTGWLKEKGVNVDAAADLDSFDPNRLIQFATTILGTIGSLSSELLLVLLLLAFMLVEIAGMRAKLEALPGYTADDDARLRRIVEDVRHYLSIKTQISLLSAVLVGAWLWLVGVDFALLWALVAFLFNFVPNIGSIIAAVPPLILALVQFGPVHALYIGAGYLAIDGLIANVLEPRMMGRGLDLSPLVVLLSLVFWGWVLGPVGLLLSVPLTILVKIVLDRSDETRWIAILLASRPPEAPSRAPPR
jgi:predicted PurR-regulated permease PerM